MKIAVFHELPIGGARDGVYYFGEGLASNGVAVDLYYVSNKEIKKTTSFFRKVYFYKFTSKKWSGGNWKARLYKDTIELYRLNELHKKIAKKVDSKNYDLIFVNGSEYIEAPFILKYVSTFKAFYCHDPNYRIVYEKILLEGRKNLTISRRIYEKINREIRKYLDKQNFNKTNLAIANSFFSKKVIKNTYGKTSEVVYPGIDINFFKPKKIKKDIDIFYIGSYEKIDGFDLLQKALRYLPKNIVLKTKMYEDGWVSDQKIITDFYQRSKVVVCLAYNEPFGSVPLEAMACGVPVIAVNEGGYKETIINGQTGYLIPREPQALAGKLEFLLNNEELRSKMGENARHHIEQNWTWDKSVNKLEKIFKEIIHEK